jgi:hypothetical protein
MIASAPRWATTRTTMTIGIVSSKRLWIGNTTRSRVAMIADNVIRNYAGWKQDMTVDPRMGRPRRDEVNWYLDMLPDAIKRMVDEGGRLAYTMEAIASLIFERSSVAPPEERRLITNLVGFFVDGERSQLIGMVPGVSPIRDYIRAEAYIDQGRRRKRARDTDEGLYGEQGYRTRVFCIPEVHHLTDCQQRQLIECLYSRVVCHMHPNMLRISKAISWIYFLHGKIGRFIGQHKTLRQT